MITKLLGKEPLVKPVEPTVEAKLSKETDQNVPTLDNIEFNKDNRPKVDTKTSNAEDAINHLTQRITGTNKY